MVRPPWFQTLARSSFVLPKTGSLRKTRSTYLQKKLAPWTAVMQPFFGWVTFSPSGASFALSASARETSPTSAMRSSTTLRRLTASASSLTGSYRLGDWTMPTSRADSARVRSLACLEKYRCEAASTP